MNLKAPAETGTLGSRINRSHRPIVVVDGLACRLRDLWHLPYPTPAVGRSSARFLIVRKPGICTHIICSISNFQFHVAGQREMWVTRQMAAHMGARNRGSHRLNLHRSIGYWSPKMLLVESRWTIRDFLFSTYISRRREETKKESRLRPNVGRSEVRLRRWTSLSRAFRDRLAEVSFSSWQKRMSSSDVLTGAYVCCRGGAFPIH